MGWDPYADLKNRAYSSILTTLFPEQTKTLPRMIVWSIIFLVDLILGICAAVHYGLLQFDTYSSANGAKLRAWLVIAAIIGIFWLQGAIWSTIVSYFQKRKNSDESAK